jgi:hypothetical protein
MDFQGLIDSIDGEKVSDDHSIMIIKESLRFVFNKNNHDNLESTFMKHGFLIPHDYKTFITKYSSASLFVHERYGGGFDVLSPERVILYWKDYSIDHPYYPIIWSSHSVGMVCVNQERIDDESGYLTWISSMEPDEPMELKLNFVNWLRMLIEYNGAEFWLNE